MRHDDYLNFFLLLALLKRHVVRRFLHFPQGLSQLLQPVFPVIGFDSLGLSLFWSHAIIEQSHKVPGYTLVFRVLLETNTEQDVGRKLWAFTVVTILSSVRPCWWKTVSSRSLSKQVIIGYTSNLSREYSGSNKPRRKLD